ncbi:histone-lysine N-methyltransferase SETD1B-like [Drosophila teissieri]|uniref:histone-lysine N-methyltransferase SETD1B-like n=1 Tax=Drosophila teissieri TaxID=7243 RepID=UPI001CBA43BF|nr:histone-lysine N-methyltransferase SETD1B-like [Drosophila teissieri]
MMSNAQNNREVRVTGTGEQPGAIWRADVESYLQLLASPLVSRSSSPIQEDTEEVPDTELSEDEAMAEGPVDYVSLSSESEEDDGGETVTPVVSSEEDEGGRSARARMTYRSPQPPLPPPAQLQPPPTQQQQEQPQPPTPGPKHREMPQPPTPQPQPPPAPPTPPPPRTPTPTPQDEEGPRCERQQSWEVDQAHVAQTLRTIGLGGRRWHQQTVTWTWPAPPEDTPEARVWEEDEDAEENPEKGPWVWPAPPPPKLARQESCPEARQPPQRPCLRRQQSLCEKPWRELERAEWPPKVVEEAEAQAGRSHKDRWAKLFVLDGQRFRLKARGPANRREAAEGAETEKEASRALEDQGQPPGAWRGVHLRSLPKGLQGARVQGRQPWSLKGHHVMSEELKRREDE